MKALPLHTLTTTLTIALFSLLFLATSQSDDKADSDAAPNTLTAAEKAAGWQLLFDGKEIKGWRSYGKDSFPAEGWVIEDGTLHKQEGKKPGDIMTVAAYENYEFSWQWKLPAGGNNGVKYMIIPERKATVGHEYQMIDDSSPSVKSEYASNASFYLVVKPAADKPNKPMGEWNTSRILVRGNHVEHWLNGAKVLEYECGSPEVMEQVKLTKFKKYPGFGEKVSGHSLLTDHKDPCWFRNLKIRELK